MHGTDQLPQPLNARLKLVKYSMHCMNYAKREQEKPLFFKLTLRSQRGVTMSCKKGDTYELFFKYIHKSRLLKKWGGNYIYMKQISSWQVFNFLLYRQSSILQDILFYIWYLTICFWIDWVHVYKYTKIYFCDFKSTIYLLHTQKLRT